MSKKEEDKMLGVGNDPREPIQEKEFIKKKKEFKGKVVHTIQRTEIMESAFKRLAAVALTPQQFKEFQESFPEIFE